MHKSNLIKLLSSLDEKDFRQLGKFVSSPYFNSNSKLIVFYKILSKYYPEFDSLEISNENFFRILYKGNEYVEGTMYYLVSEMEGLVEKFISHEKIDSLMLDVSLLSYLNISNIENLYAKKYKTLFNKLDEFNDPNNLYHVLLSGINLSRVTRKREVKTKKDSFKKELYDPIEELVKFFLRNLISSLETIFNYKITVNEKLKIPLIDDILQVLEKSDFIEKDFETKILYYRIKMIMKYDIEIFNYLKDVARNNPPLGKMSLNELITSLQLFCTHQVNTGKDFVAQEFEVIMLFEKYNKDALKKFAKIDFYFQIFALALSLGKYEWLKKFHKKYSLLIDEKFKNNAIHYANAQFNYLDKQYDKALKELAQIKSYSFVHYKPAVKILQMRIYFELGFISEAEDLLNTFSQFLRNDMLITPHIKKAYYDFCKIYLKLVHSKSTGSVKKIRELKFAVEKQKDFLIARRWFNLQIGIIENESVKNKARISI